MIWKCDPNSNFLDTACPDPSKRPMDRINPSRAKSRQKLKGAPTVNGRDPELEPQSYQQASALPPFVERKPLRPERADSLSAHFASWAVESARLAGISRTRGPTCQPDADLREITPASQNSSVVGQCPRKDSRGSDGSIDHESRHAPEGMGTRVTSTCKSIWTPGLSRMVIAASLNPVEGRTRPTDGAIFAINGPRRRLP